MTILAWQGRNPRTLSNSWSGWAQSKALDPKQKPPEPLQLKAVWGLSALQLKPVWETSAMKQMSIGARAYHSNRFD